MQNQTSPKSNQSQPHSAVNADASPVCQERSVVQLEISADGFEVTQNSVKFLPNGIQISVELPSCPTCDQNVAAQHQDQKLCDPKEQTSNDTAQRGELKTRPKELKFILKLSNEHSESNYSHLVKQQQNNGAAATPTERANFTQKSTQPDAPNTNPHKTRLTTSQTKASHAQVDQTKRASNGKHDLYHPISQARSPLLNSQSMRQGCLAPSQTLAPLPNPLVDQIRSYLGAQENSRSTSLNPHVILQNLDDQLAKEDKASNQSLIDQLRLALILPQQTLGESVLQKQSQAAALSKLQNAGSTTNGLVTSSLVEQVFAKPLSHGVHQTTTTSSGGLSSQMCLSKLQVPQPTHLFPPLNKVTSMTDANARSLLSQLLKEQQTGTVGQNGHSINPLKKQPAQNTSSAANENLLMKLVQQLNLLSPSQSALKGGLQELAQASLKAEARHGRDRRGSNLASMLHGRSAQQQQQYSNCNLSNEAMVVAKSNANISSEPSSNERSENFQLGSKRSSFVDARPLQTSQIVAKSYEETKQVGLRKNKSLEFTEREQMIVDESKSVDAAENETLIHQINKTSRNKPIRVAKDTKNQLSPKKSTKEVLQMKNERGIQLESADEPMDFGGELQSFVGSRDAGDLIARASLKDDHQKSFKEQFELSSSGSVKQRSSVDSLDPIQMTDDSMNSDEEQMLYDPFGNNPLFSKAAPGPQDGDGVLKVSAAIHLNQLTYCVSNRDFDLMRKQQSLLKTRQLRKQNQLQKSKQLAQILQKTTKGAADKNRKAKAQAESMEGSESNGQAKLINIKKAICKDKKTNSALKRTSLEKITKPQLSMSAAVETDILESSPDPYAALTIADDHEEDKNEDCDQDDSNSLQYCCKLCKKRFQHSSALGGHISKAHPGQSDAYNHKKRVRETRELERGLHRHTMQIYKEQQEAVLAEQRKGNTQIQQLNRNSIKRIKKMLVLKNDQYQSLRSKFLGQTAQNQANNNNNQANTDSQQDEPQTGDGQTNSHQTQQLSMRQERKQQAKTRDEYTLISSLMDEKLPMSTNLDEEVDELLKLANNTIDKSEIMKQEIEVKMVSPCKQSSKMIDPALRKLSMKKPTKIDEADRQRIMQTVTQMGQDRLRKQAMLIQPSRSKEIQISLNQSDKTPGNYYQSLTSLNQTKTAGDPSPKQ